MLRGYRRQWNEQMGVWRAEPVHDQSSHAADAFGTGVQGAAMPDDDRKPGPKLFTPPKLPTGPGSWLAR